MKIEYIYEAGVFGSYKKANIQSNIDNVKKELTKCAQKSIIESKCDELAELYLDMLNEVNSKANAISCKYNYKSTFGQTYYVISELSNYAINRYFRGSKKKREMQLNIIKNVYCNRSAIEYMVSQGCFILPLVDITNTWRTFYDYKDVISYKNMIKSIVDAAEKVIKLHLSKFPSYSSAIPNKVKIVILQSYNVHISGQEEKLFSYMGITDKCDFEYPVGQGSSCLNYILDNCATNTYHFKFMDRFPELYVNIGKKITSEKAEQEGISIDDFEYDIYEFDYKDTTEVESAAKKIVNVCDELLTNAGADKSTKQHIKQIAEDAVKNYLPKLMSRILKSKPHCVCYSNKIILSGNYPKGYVIKNDNNLRALINTTKMQLNKKGNLVFYIDIDFSVPVRGINPKYIKDYSKQTSEIYYEYIYGKQIKIEIPLI